MINQIFIYSGSRTKNTCYENRKVGIESEGTFTQVEIIERYNACIGEVEEIYSRTDLNTNGIILFLIIVTLVIILGSIIIFLIDRKNDLKKLSRA